MLNTTIIVADSEVESRKALVQVLEGVLGYKVVGTGQHKDIIDLLYQPHEAPPEAILMDVASASTEVEQVFSQLQARFPCLPVIALTDYGSMKQATQALEMGAVEYLARPVSHQRLKVSVANAIRQYRLAQEVSRMRREQATRNEMDFLPSHNSRQRRFMGEYNYKEGALLISGEKGAGKEALARAYHRVSERKFSPFVSIHCAALAETQAWTILFGEKKADENNHKLSSKLLGALSGTLYINGVDSLSKLAQRQLVRVLQDSTHQPSLRRKGENSGIRLMVASPLPMELLLQQGTLAPELLDYIGQQVVSLPALRHSIDDIDSLAEYFTERFALQENPMLQGITPEALELLKIYDWPENVLELERLIFRAVISCEDTMLHVPHLLPYLPTSFVPSQIEGEGQQGVAIRSGRMPLTNAHGEVRRLRELESDMIHFALDFYDGRISEVARKLGIGRSTLYRKLNELDIKVA